LIRSIYLLTMSLPLSVSSTKVLGPETVNCFLDLTNPASSNTCRWAKRELLGESRILSRSVKVHLPTTYRERRIPSLVELERTGLPVSSLILSSLSSAPGTLDHLLEGGEAGEDPGQGNDDPS